MDLGEEGWRSGWGLRVKGQEMGKKGGGWDLRENRSNPPSR